MSQAIQGEIITPAEWKGHAQPKSIDEQVRDELGQDAAAAMAICERLSCEAEPLAKIAGEILGMEQRPALHKFYRWRMRAPSLSRLYARAREMRADVIADEIIEIVDKEPDPHKARARMDARKWVAGKFNRGMYGDDVQVTGAGGGAIQHDVNHGGQVLDEISRRLSKRAKRIAEVGGEGVRAENLGGDGYTLPHTLGSHTKAPSDE